MKDIIVTGSHGFIGYEVCRQFIAMGYRVFGIDSNTYAAVNKDKTRELGKNYIWIDHDITLPFNPVVGFQKLKKTLSLVALVNCAAETHVDNPIHSPAKFITTNVVGTHNMLELARNLNIRFVQVSTDEIYGPYDKETHGEKYPTGFRTYAPYNPSSPYSSSKAGAELLVKSYSNTYDLDIVITRGSNTFGPNQYPEKFIPKLINCIREGKPFPLYGNGLQRRQWISVKEHAEGILKATLSPYKDKIVNIASCNSISNIELISQVRNRLNKDIIINLVEDKLEHNIEYFISPDIIALDDKVVKFVVDGVNK